MDNVNSSGPNNKTNCASWSKRTLLERYLILMCLALFLGFITLIGLHIFYRYDHRVPVRRICNSPACKREAGRFLKYIDSTVNPCVDFYNFACGSFVKYERFAEKRVHGMLEGEEYIKRYSKDTIEEADENAGPKFVKKLKQFYNSCMTKPTDTSEIIKELLNRTSLWYFPVYDDASGEKLTLEEVLAITNIFGEDENSLFSISNYKNNLRITKGRSFMDWNKFLDKTEDDVRMTKEKYIHLLTLTEFHSTKPSYNLGDEAYGIVDFQTALANVTHHMADEGDVVIKVSELEEICPEVKWNDLLKNLFESFGRLDEALNLSERNITVGNVQHVRDVCHLINIWGTGVVQNVLVWNFLTQGLVHLDASFHKSFSEIDTNNYRLMSSKHYPVKWKQCIWCVEDNSVFNAGLVYLVIERMKPDKFLEEVEEYKNNIVKVMDHMFGKEDWLDDETKKVLRKQLHEIDAAIGYSKESRDVNLVEDQLKDAIVSDSYIENWLQSKKLFSTFSLIKGERIISSRIPAPLVFNLFGGGGSIDIPLGSIVPPLFTPNIPKYLNYGAIGFLIAHEISHSFDHEAHLEYINASAEALEIFKKKSECYVKQYSALPLGDKGVMVDGEMTIRDNIADNSGIVQAFSAYQDYARRKGEEEGLPGLNYTNRQMFFIKYAHLWCEILESPAEIYKNDGHSPGKYRVREPLKNFPSFSQEFNCPRGSFMNPQHKCRLWG